MQRLDRATAWQAIVERDAVHGNDRGGCHRGALRVEPAVTGSLLFAVIRDGRVESFAAFGDFVSRVSSLLGSGRNMVALTARGTYDEDERTLATRYVAVSFTP